MKTQLIEEAYRIARERYAAVGVDTDEALEKLQRVSLSLHCWQADDVTGFENRGGELTGGIQATGNYPGKARNVEELRADILKAASYIPGTHRLNLHEIYGEFGGEKVDRNEVEVKHFAGWIEWARAHGMKLDFNSTSFSHPKSGSLSLSNPDPEIREFWIEHGKACRKIANYFGEELGITALDNIWIPDGTKDVPADRIGPRARLKEALDEILSVKYDRKNVADAVEGKVFGIGVESYTVGSHEFYMNYAAKNGLMCLLDTGHYHPTEVVSDKISSMLLFNDSLALHVSRPVRWDSDHVIKLDDELKELATELVRCDALQKVFIGLDFFDASINRIAAWVIGMRNMQKALLYGLLTPNKELKEAQDRADFTKVLQGLEEIKTLPFGDVWAEFCQRNEVPVDGKWYPIVKEYEKDVLFKR